LPVAALDVIPERVDPILLALPIPELIDPLPRLHRAQARVDEACRVDREAVGGRGAQHFGRPPLRVEPEALSEQGLTARGPDPARLPPVGVIGVSFPNALVSAYRSDEQTINPPGAVVRVAEPVPARVGDREQRAVVRSV